MVDLSKSNFTIRYSGIEFPNWSIYEAEYPVRVNGHLKLFVETALKKLKTRYVSNIAEGLVNIGSVNGPDNGTGMLGIIANEEADLGFFAIPPTFENIKYFDFTIPVLEENWMILSSGNAQQDHGNGLEIISVFKKEVWLGCGLLLFMFPFIQVVNDVLSGHYSSKDSSMNYFNHFLITFQLLLGKSTKLGTHRKVSTRILLGFHILTTFCLYLFYTQSILSKVTAPPKPLRIDHIEQVFDYGEKRILIVKDTTSEHLLKNSESQLFKRVWGQVLASGGLTEIFDLNFQYEFNEMYQHRSVALLPDYIIIDGAQRLVNCNDFIGKVYISRVPVYNLLVGFPIRKTLTKEYSEIFKKVTSSMHETGILMHSLRLSIWSGMKCFTIPVLPEDGDDLRTITFRKLFVPFTALICAYGLSLLLLIYFWVRQVPKSGNEKIFIKR